MGDTLQKRLHTLVMQVFQAGPGAWMVWCDPDGHWLPLLRRVATDRRMDAFDLMEVTEQTGKELGGPVSRVALQQRLADGLSFVLYVPVAREELGWLWGQALLAEQIYDTSLRGQLMEWGWRPHSLTVGDEEVAALARENLQQDPAEWGADGLQPDFDQLLEVLAALRDLEPESRLRLDLTVEQCGLPPIDDADLVDWRRRSLAMLLVTDAHRVAPDLVPESHERVIPNPARNLAMDLIDRWTDSLRLTERLPQAIDDADAVAGLTSLLREADATYRPFVSHAAERMCFANTCGRLAQLTGRSLMDAVAGLKGDLERHQRALWGDRVTDRSWAVPWGELARLCFATDELLTASPDSRWATPQDAIDWYVEAGWRMDRAGEEIERNLDATAPELTALIVPLRNAYRARWEETAIHWSACWVDAGCPIPEKLGTAGGWLRAALEAEKTPTAVLILDALRYDLGATLAERLNQAEGVERAVIDPARAPVPSITALGMGVALPIDEDRFQADLVKGKWQLRRADSDENFSIAQTRRDWWAKQSNTKVTEGLAVLLRDPIPAPENAGQRLIAYDATIDSMGHDDELEFRGSSPAIQRYLTAIERLREAGWRRILIVTDHGFVRWSGTQEHHVSFPLGEPAYASRRAAAYASTETLEGPQALAPGGKWKIAFPHGVACFRTYGGLGYFHGGASLQEWIIPCLIVKWPETAQPVAIQIEPIARILSQRPKVTLQVTKMCLLPEDNIPRQVEIVIRNAVDQSILFRSAIVIATGDETKLEVTVPATAERPADRNTPLLIQIRDPRTEALLAEEDSTLMIELGGW